MAKESCAYIFDYGGTLDTGGRHWGKVLWRAYQDTGVPVSEKAFREAYVQAERQLATSRLILPVDTFRHTLDVKLRLELELLGCMAWHDQLLDVLYEQAQRHTAASATVLRRLKTDSALALVTNFYGNIHTVLQEFGLDGLFSPVIESAAVGVRKPDPRLFSMALEALSLAPAEVTVVGDSIAKDILPAKSLGCRTIWLRGEQWSDEPVDQTIPDSIIESIEELIGS